ncbi:MAG TPA: PadR family transcriptional regulator [Roseiflexaceae bacterium]
MSPMVKLPLSLEHALLGFLYAEPMHAYEIHQRLEQAQALGLVWRLKQSQLYALLARLEDAGYIESMTEPQGNRPPRKILSLTSSGRTAFAQWMLAPVAHGRDFRQEFLAKLFFAQRDSPATAARLIADQQQACRDWLIDLRAQAGAIGDDRPYDWLVLQFRISNLEAIVSWLDTCASTLAVPALC